MENKANKVIRGHLRYLPAGRRGFAIISVKNMSYFYGPVPSRRLGFSLGVNLTPKKFCTLDCIYCQLRKTTKKTVKRFFYVDLIEFKKELTKIINNNPKIDYISISGSGEPTLHKRLDKIIDTIKETTNNEYRVCVITNSSLLYKKEVRNELSGADLIIPSLDAATNKSFSRIDKPHKQITLKKVVDGLINLRKEFKGKIWLEIMLLGGINDSLAEAKKFKILVAKIKPDKVQLNLPVRPAGINITLPDYKRIKEIKKIIGKRCEIVLSFYKDAQKKFSKSVQNDIIKYLNIRPATMRDLEKSVGLGKNVLAKQIEKMLNLGLIIKKMYNRKVYFICDKAA
ncbi:MAG: radical SAM protein [Candidatus Omnitrophota bacterium]|jgi:wyosine [tRNA(Phe)-imidazoG37] synthetase (radical SAM superfamily)